MRRLRSDRRREHAAEYEHVRAALPQGRLQRVGSARAKAFEVDLSVDLELLNEALDQSVEFGVGIGRGRGVRQGGADKESWEEEPRIA
jgi:hypothetical protein